MTEFNKKEVLKVIKLNPYVKKWVEKYSESQRNKRYSVIEKYCAFLDKNPSQILEEHHKDIHRDNPLKIENIAKTQLFYFYGYLINSDDKYKNELNDKVIEKVVSINSARQYVFSVLCGFFKRNNVPINFEKGEIPKEKVGVKSKTWTNGEIRVSERKEALKNIRDSFSNIRDKAILLCKVSSGMDDCDLFELKIKDYKNGYYLERNVAYIEGNRKKSDTRYQTFFNSEACDFIKLYLNQREKSNIDKNSKKDIKTEEIEKITNNSWLFASTNGKKMKRSRFSENMKEVCKKLDLNNITPKSLRRYFSTILKRNHIDYDIIQRVMGHTGAVSQYYQDLFEDIDNFTKFYTENIEEFTLLGNGHKKLNNLEKEVSILTNILTSNAFKNILNIQYERLRDDHNQYVNADNEFKEKTQELEDDFQDLKELMDKIDNLNK